MSDDAVTTTADGQVPTAQRVADIVAIQSLAVAYGFAVDDADWQRWEDLFVPDAHIDYRYSAGIEGTPAQVGAWLPGAMSVFSWSLHSISTHEIRFTGDDTATGRVHLFNRNGLEWEGTPEICDVGGVYVDRYRRVGDRWKFSERIERCHYLTGGAFAAMVRSLAAGTSPDGTAPMG